MKYTRIKIEFKEFEDRFNRTILVKGNIDLFKLETFLAFILHSEFEHCYLIYTKDYEYVMAPFMQESFKRVVRYAENYHLNDLPDNFEFLYDTGDNYMFTCKKEGTTDIDSRKTFILESAKGQGIWEDNSYSLRSFLLGEIDPSSTMEDAQIGFFLPWNFNNKTFGDFDKEVDINKENERISKNFSTILSLMRKNEKEYIEDCNVLLDDISPIDSNYEKFKIKKELEEVSKKKA